MAHAVLIVDDDIAIKESVEEFLALMTYDVKSAENAFQAVDILKTFQPDIVLTDIMMQGMDGLELTRLIREQYAIDVMVMTGYSADYSYEEAINAGASDFIFKPFRFEELDLRIKRMLREAAFKKERDKLLEEMKQLAITDGLGDLHNLFYHQMGSIKMSHLGKAGFRISLASMFRIAFFVREIPFSYTSLLSLTIG